jgi:hypothetical protein
MQPSRWDFSLITEKPVIFYLQQTHTIFPVLFPAFPTSLLNAITGWIFWKKIRGTAVFPQRKGIE